MLEPNMDVENRITQELLLCACDELPPLATWIEEGIEDEDNPECRPCALSLLMGEYQEVLVDNGRDDIAQQIQDCIDVEEGDDILARVAVVLDKAKGDVDNSLKVQLCTLDAQAMEAAKELELHDPQD